MAAARNHAFEVVVAEGLDRQSCDQEATLGIYKQLSFRGIIIVTQAERGVTELHVGLKGTMNALFLKDLAIKTHRGLEGPVRKGRAAAAKLMAIVRSSVGSSRHLEADTWPK